MERQKSQKEGERERDNAMRKLQELQKREWVSGERERGRERIGRERVSLEIESERKREKGTLEKGNLEID